MHIMVYGDNFEVTQSSFALSETEIESLLDGDKRKGEKKRKRLPERIQRLLYDIALFSQSGLLDDQYWNEGWEDLLERCSDEQVDSPPIENINSETYEFGYLGGKALRQLQDDFDQITHRSLLVGILDGMIDDSYISIENQRDFKKVCSSIESLLESYEIDIETMVEATIKTKDSPSLDWKVALEYDIELSTGSQLLILSKLKLNEGDCLREAIEEVLEETKLSLFNELADFLNQDMPHFTQSKSGSLRLSDAILGIISLENSSSIANEGGKYTADEILGSGGSKKHIAKDIASETKGSNYKSNAGKLLGDVSDSSGNGRWETRPVINKHESRPAAEYELTSYGRLLFRFYTQETFHPRVRLHKLAWYDYWKTSETVSDIQPDELLGDEYEQDLQIAIAAAEEVLS